MVKKEEFLRSLLRERWENGQPVGNLSQVANRHGQVLRPEDLPDGVRCESAVRLMDGGLNGKRPQYVVAAQTGELFPAQGYFMGRESELTVYQKTYHIFSSEVRPNFRLTPEEETQLNFCE